MILVDGIVSYDMPQGEKRGSELDLSDMTYDGEIKDGYLHGGLGQLTDGAEGDFNFRLENQNVGIKGYEWIGWKNDSRSKPIEIKFVFDVVRNFSQLIFHTNNMWTKDIRIFRMARVTFSVGCELFQSVVIYKNIPDTLVEYARPVIIPLQHNVGRCVNVELFFDAKWLMISEVQFDSGMYCILQNDFSYIFCSHLSKSYYY